MKYKLNLPSSYSSTEQEHSLMFPLPWRYFQLPPGLCVLAAAPYGMCCASPRGAHLSLPAVTAAGGCMHFISSDSLENVWHLQNVLSQMVHWTSLWSWLTSRGEIYVSYIFPIAAHQRLGQSLKHVLKLH